jgi:transcriptional regulator with XRE-family HTH domain
MDIGTRLRELREAKLFSQGEIEKRTGLLRCYVSRVECGHTIPSLETLEKWAKALDIELYQLFFTGQGEPQTVKASTGTAVSRDGRKLLADLGKMSPRRKRLLLSLARFMARQKAG